MNGKNLSGIFEQMMQDRRSDVIRQIAIDTKVLAGQLTKINCEDIAGNNCNVWPLARMRANFFTQLFSQQWIGFDSYHSTPVASQHLGHFSMARADFNPCFVCSGRKNLENALPPRGVAEKVLSHALSGHADAKCSNAAPSEAKKCGRNYSARSLKSGRQLA